MYLAAFYTHLVCAAPNAAEVSFEQALQALHNNKPHLFEPTEQKQEQPSSWTSYENCSTAIDLTALASALVRIYIRHNQLLAAKTDNSGMWNTIFKKIFPESMQKLSNQTLWLKDSCIITVETILYKTVAKLALYCSKGDGYDLIKKAFMKAKSIVLG